ncbi:hypothetical protein S245_024661, partial [Arachis hypogaea]
MRAPKIPKVEQECPFLDYPKPPIAIVNATNQIQPELAGKSTTLLRQGGSAVRHAELISRLDSPIFLIPM